MTAKRRTITAKKDDLLNSLRQVSSEILDGVRLGSYRLIISRLLEAERKDETRHLGQIMEYLSSASRN
jgi:hypothetical protein